MAEIEREIVESADRIKTLILDEQYRLRDLGFGTRADFFIKGCLGTLAQQEKALLPRFWERMARRIHNWNLLD